MSRSHKYHTFATICRGRNKKAKRIANRKFRRINNLAIKHNLDKLLYKLREVSNTYNFPTDGLAYYQNPKEWKRYMYYTDEELKEIYRKILQK